MTTESRLITHSQSYIDALGWAADLHQRQQRKGKPVPYISHLIAVSALIWEDGGDEDQAIAGLLHDAIEDAGITAEEIAATGKAAFVMHWKSLRRQVRVRGLVSREDGPQADAYYASRSLPSRLGAWASKQSRPLSSRAGLMAEVAKITATKGTHPPRPPFWGGFRIVPVEFEFWADGEFRLHDRFRWQRRTPADPWEIQRLNP